MTNALRFLLGTTLIFTMLLMGACGGGEKDDGRVIEYRDRPTASVSGQLIVPEEIDPLAIPVFAEGTSFMAVTDEEGRFRISGLTVGEYRIRASRPDIETLTIGSISITAEDLEKEQPVLVFEPMAVSIRERGAGREMGLRATAVSSLRGSVTTTVPGDERGVIVMIEGTSYAVSTAGDGAFEIMDIRPGSYTVSFVREGYRRETRTVEFTAGNEEDLGNVQLNLDESQSASAIGADNRSIFGRIVAETADGRQISDFRPFRVLLEGTQFSATPDERGRFSFQNLPANSYTVSASAPGYILERRFSVNLTSIPAVEVNLTLLEDIIGVEDMGSLVGRVLLDGGEPETAPGVTVSLAGTNLNTTTGSDGFYAFLEVEPGDYTIVTSYQGWKPASQQIRVAASLDPTEAPDIRMARDVIAPRVVYTDPAVGATGVTIDQPTKVIVQFSEEMEPTSVVNAISVSPNVAFRVTTEGGGLAGGRSTFTVELYGIRTDNQPPLRYGTAYTIRVASSAQSLRGVPMENDFSFRFTTGYAEVIGSLPANGEREYIWAENRPIRIYFNAPLNPDSIRRDDVTVRPSIPYNVYMQNDSRTGWSVLYITGTPNLDTAYEVSVRGGRTITGERVRNMPFRIRFNTSRGRTPDELYGQPNNDDLRRIERERQGRR